jgi:phytoene dehydrogenase-like protein
VAEAVVIGSGPNGLVAANLLADQGWEVVVMEAETTPGGAVRSGELVEPGYTNDLFSAFYPLAVASPAIARLGLERHGLEWRRAPLVLAHPARDGTCPVLSTDLEETSASLERLSPGDGEAWQELYGGWERAGSTLLEGLLSPFPPVAAGLSLAARMRPGEAVHLARFCLLPVRRLGEEQLHGEPARRLLAGAALHADLSPEAVLSGLHGWVLCCLGQAGGWPVPRGGAGRLTDALVERLGSRGGRILCGARATEIVVRQGRAVAVRSASGLEVGASRAVVADVSAPSLYLELLRPDVVPPQVADDARRRFRWDPATVKVDWTLDAPIPWSSPGARRAGTVHIADSVDELTISSALLAAGILPARPFVIVGQQGLADPSRHPHGRSVAWAYTRVPQRVKGDAGGQGIAGRWDKADTAAIVDRIEGAIEELAPGFRSRVRGCRVMVPPGLAAHDANLPGGAVSGGTAELYQQALFRPIPGWGRPTTPVRGLFLGSAAVHPGGGVHGACGANAAGAAIASDRRRRFVAAMGRSGSYLASRLGQRDARRPDGRAPVAGMDAPRPARAVRKTG